MCSYTLTLTHRKSSNRELQKRIIKHSSTIFANQNFDPGRKHFNRRHIAKCRPSIQDGFHVNYLHQQMRETITKYFTVIFFPNTMMSFLYISTASAPIHNTAARVKYWINSDMTVQPASVSVRSSPTRTNSSMKNMAILSCACNLLASR